MCVLAMAGSTQGAWAADTETKTVLRQDFEACDGTIPFGNYNFNGKSPYTAEWSLKTSGSNTVLQAYSNVNGGRTGYVDFGVNSSSVTDNWTLSFDCAITPCTAGQQQMVVTAANNAVTANNMITSAAYLILTNESASSTSYSVTIGDVTLDDKITLASGTMYNYTLALTEANTSTASLNVIIKNGDSEILNTKQTVDPLTMGFLRGFFDYNGKNAGTEKFDNIVLTKEVAAGVCEKPNLKLTGANLKARKFKLSCLTDDATIYYSETNLTAGADGWIKYEKETEIETTATTIYAYAATSSANSDVIPFETGAGTVLTLNAPVVEITNFVKNGSSYNPVYEFSSDQSSILGKPNVTYTYTINEVTEESTTSYQATTTGDLVVTASAKGYEDASTTVNIQNCNFAKAFNYDFSTFTEHSGTAVGNRTNVNGKGCQAYQIDADAVDGITINMNLLWAITNNNAVGLYARTGKGSITYKGDFPAGSYAIFSNYGSPVVSSSATTEFLMYGLALDMAVYTPTASISLPYTYTTFSSTAALDFTDNADVEAYMAQMNGDGTAVTLKQVQKVPAGAGVVLKKISGAETTTVNVLESAADLAGNQLVGVTEDNTVSADQLIEAGNAYVLVEEQFCKVVTGAMGYIPAGKAYLSVPVRNAAKALRLDFNGTPTEVVSVAAKAEKAQDAIYNVQGIRVQKPTVPGLYIVNGKTYRF